METSTPSLMVAMSLARFPCWLHNGCVTTEKMRMSRHNVPQSNRGTVFTIPWDFVALMWSLPCVTWGMLTGSLLDFDMKLKINLEARSSSSYHFHTSLMEPHLCNLSVGPFSRNDLKLADVIKCHIGSMMSLGHWRGAP